MVYKDTLKLSSNVSFSLLKNSQGIKAISEIDRYYLYERYSQSFYIRKIFIHYSSINNNNTIYTVC